MSDRSTTHATFSVERTYDAPPARVWRAWTDPEEKRRWFGPRELARPDYAFDFRVGGVERMTVQTPDGTPYTFDALYQDVVEGERFVHTYAMYRGEQRISVSVATVELEPDGAGTKLTLTEQGVFLDGLDTPAEREHGTRELLETLAAALAGAGEAA